MENNTSGAPPVLNFSSYYSNDAAAKQKLVEQVKQCCLHNGFFQIVNTNVPISLQEKTMKWCERFFDMPLEEKVKVSKDNNTWNRGYELLRSQILEAGTLPELKEGYYIGEELPKTHPYFVEKKLNSGPNQWPETMEAVEDFKSTTMEYYKNVKQLQKDILSVLALTLDLPESYFDEYASGAVATMRLLHYPQQPADSTAKLTRGIGAHTDFGAITVLMQGDVEGLQVLEEATGEWLDVMPMKGAFVVNLGNLMMRWSNDRYISNIHRVINKSGKERYSIPVFFSGNPDFVIDTLPNCLQEGEAPKYPPISVSDAVGGSYKASYGAAEKFKKEAAAKAAASMTMSQPMIVA